MELTRRNFEYLAAVYEEEVDGITRLYKIAERLNVKPPSARKALKDLEFAGYVERLPGRGYRLTNEGKVVYLKFLWKHRILETFFCRILGFSPDEACRSVACFDAYVPESVIARMCEILEHPVNCPHGFNIPHFPHRGDDVE
ncbi:MAG: metal-dependent transcriptional regulator [Thermoprotei archaeon]|nr:MAG: metal-dependent transcriptional regulator [Thermoprotei archaeon]